VRRGEAMTQDELDQLPECGGDGFGMEDIMVDGVLRQRPVVMPMFVLYQDEHDVMLMEDRQGRVWTTGWHGGVHYKRRRLQYELFRAGK
jgi:hypothetical protein